MAGPITIPDGGVALKDPADIAVYAFDWGTDFLTTGVTITTSTFTITALRPSGDTALTKDQESTLSDGQTTQLRLSAGTLGALYRINNQIVTSESPTQTIERSFLVKIEQR